MSLRNQGGNKIMEIIKKETLRFSDKEIQHLDMAFMLMENVANIATHPELVRLAGQVVKSLAIIFDNFIETEEEE
jgi:hypothetical protein